MGLATSAEFAGRAAAAGAFFAHAERAGAGVSAAIGRARCEAALGRHAAAAARLEAVNGVLRGAVQPAQAAIRARVRSRAHGTGLGLNRLLAPQVEPVAFLLAAYAAEGRVDAAREVVLGLDADALVSIASMLQGDEVGAAVYTVLFAAALAAEPPTLAVERAAHAERWRAWVAAHAR